MGGSAHGGAVPLGRCPPAVRGQSLAYFEKLACTLVSAFIVNVQLGAAPLQAPLQPVKLLPVLALAVSVTVLPGLQTP